MGSSLLNNDLPGATGGPSNEAPPQVPPQDEPVGEDSRIDSQDTDDDPMEVDPEDDTSEYSADHHKDCSAPVYYHGTGLYGGLPADLPTDRMDVIIRLSGAYGPSLSQMFCSATENRTDWHQISRATLRSHHAEYLEFCRCLLDQHGIELWDRILTELSVNSDEHWTAYAARFATLPPLPAHLAFPAPVWPFVSSMIFLYCQPRLQTALARLMNWQVLARPPSPSAMHMSGFSAGSYTAFALVSGMP